MYEQEALFKIKVWDLFFIRLNKTFHCKKCLGHLTFIRKFKYVRNFIPETYYPKYKILSIIEEYP